MSSTKIENEFWAGIPEEKRPRHIAMIMDGNGRWAQQRDQPRIKGHQQGAETVREITEECARLGICLLYTSPSPRDGLLSRMPSSA